MVDIGWEVQLTKMSQFYARYVPPSASKDLPTARSVSVHKRPSTSKPPRVSKKRKLEQEPAADGVSPEAGVTGSAHQSKQSPQSPVTAPEVLEELPTKQGRSSPVEVSRWEQTNGAKAEHAGATAGARENDNELRLTDGEVAPSKHSRVLSRFGKAQERASRHQETTPRPSVDHVHPDRANIVHDLEPIPQPDVQIQERPALKYSTAPQWLRNPLTVKHNDKRKFEELGLNKKILQKLLSQQKDEALPVQSAVLPLLLDKEVHQRPDLCVAAATGSGKTFAYTLPILSALRKRKHIRLRAVIVVPTRALVKQVVQALESCSAGLDVRVGTAEGSKTLADEQRQLVEETMVYNPEEYKRQRDAPIDWDTFSLDALLEQATTREPVMSAGYVQRFLSKVDVLVCTPGRLIEHLQTTKGFNLDDVQWFVADEADRLLNESYHEWLDTVLPALKSQKATEQRDKLLAQMHMDVPKRRVTKILLSATMTNDISQLLALELTDPKLVVVEAADTQQSSQDNIVNMIDVNDNAEFSMPPRLVESAVAFKDSENKPLYLLELLEKHIFNNESTPLEAKKKPLINGTPNHDLTTIDRHDLSSSSADSDEDTSSDDSSSSASSESDATSDTSSVSSDDTSSSASDSDSASSLSPTPSSTKRPNTSTPPKHPRVLIFTRSTESAHRLSRLLSLLHPVLAPLIATFTRASTANANDAQSQAKKASSKSLIRTRSKILHSFTTGQTRILISTDVAARGLDIPNLEHVVNYDVPPSPLIYVHRVGRTARAGQAGHAWTLVEHRQGKWFWETIGGKVGRDGDKKVIGRGNQVVQKVGLVIDKGKWMGRYEDALRRLGEDVRGQ